jgi:uncharacterized C2H2 Zn-finger protein
MGKLPKELFDIGDSRVKREYNFIDLNGEETSIELDFGDRLSEARCPIDGANIVVYSGDPHTVAECPACGEQFSRDNQYNLVYIKDSLIPNKKSKLNKLKEEANKLEKIIKLAEDSNNAIKEANLNNSCYNKANLSAIKQESFSKIRDIVDRYIKNLKKGPKTH